MRARSRARRPRRPSASRLPPTRARRPGRHRPPDRAVEEEAGCRHDDLVPRPQDARMQMPSACMAPFVTSSSVSGSTRAAGRALQLAERGLSQRRKAAGRRCGHGTAEHGGDGLHHVGREGRRGRAVERPRLHAGARAARAVSPPRRSGTRRSRHGKIRGDHGQQHVRGIPARVQDRLVGHLHAGPRPDVLARVQVAREAREARARHVESERWPRRKTLAVGSSGSGTPRPRPARAARPTRPRGCFLYRARMTPSVRRIERPSGYTSQRRTKKSVSRADDAA